MAEGQDNDSKTEEPSAHKLEEARKRGEMPKSMDVAQGFALCAVCILLICLGGGFATNLAQALIPFFASPYEMLGDLDAGGGNRIAAYAVQAGAPFVLAAMLTALVAGSIGHIIQTGFNFTPEKLKPNFSKLNPFTGFGRLFGVDAFLEYLKNLIKLIAAAFIVYNIVKDRIVSFPNLAAISIGGSLMKLKDCLMAIVIGILILTVIVGGVDWFIKRMRFTQRMRMSREEVKEEYRQQEGDPHVKAKLKQIRNEKSRKRMAAGVKKATVIVTNPTHYAVALRYVPGETDAPLCVAKGVDSLALKIRELATESSIPIIEDPPLARALYATVDIDEAIPREHFEAVAKVISFVMSRASARARRRAK